MNPEPFAESDAGVIDRINQIKWTAHRVRATDVGVWTSAGNQPLSAADMVVIAPADLLWLTSLAARVTTPERIGE